MKKIILVAVILTLAGCSSNDGGSAGGAGEFDAIGNSIAESVKNMDLEIETPKIDIPDINTLEPLPESSLDMSELEAAMKELDGMADRLKFDPPKL